MTDLLHFGGSGECDVVIDSDDDNESDVITVSNPAGFASSSFVERPRDEPENADLETDNGKCLKEMDGPEMRSQNYIWCASERNCIGKGGFGEVYRGSNRNTKQLVAIKVFDPSKPVKYRENFSELRELDCPYIIKYLAEEQVIDSDLMILVMELANTSMRYELTKPEHRLGIPKETFLVLIDHCVSALEYLDARKWAHRDLKPDNILVFKQPELIFKLTDFGCCHILNRPERVMHSQAGTIRYWPTAMIGQAASTTRSACVSYTKDQIDRWATVCCFFECSTCRFPFSLSDQPGDLLDRQRYLAALKDVQEGLHTDVVSAYFDNEVRQYAYEKELPLQHASYSKSFRRILCKFFQMMFNAENAIMEMPKFVSICREMTTMKRYTYYSLNSSSVEEEYDTSSSEYFPRTPFEEAMLFNGTDTRVDNAGDAVSDTYLGLLDDFPYAVCDKAKKFAPNDDYAPFIAGLIPAKVISHCIPTEDIDAQTSSQKTRKAGDQTDGLDPAAPCLVVLISSFHGIRRIIEQGAYARVDEKGGVSLLDLACREGHLAIVKYLIENGADVDDEDADGITPLMMAVAFKRSVIVDFLLKHGAAIDTLLRASGCCSAFHIAVHCGNLEIVKLLFEHGANINVPNGAGFTPLHLACETCDYVTAKYLVENGADIDAKDFAGATPLINAVRNGAESIVQLLLQRGAAVNVVSEDGTSAIHAAVRRLNEDIVKQLVSHGADLGLAAKKGRTPLHDACKLGCLNIVTCLVDNDADINASDASGVTPLMLASKTGRNNIVMFLLNRCSPVDKLAHDGTSALHYAASHGNLDGVMLLVQSGADVNLMNENHFTPLHCACYGGSIIVAALLRDYGADPELSKPGTGITPRMVAEMNNDSEYVPVLTSIEDDQEKSSGAFSRNRIHVILPVKSLHSCETGKEKIGRIQGEPTTTL